MSLPLVSRWYYKGRLRHIHSVSKSATGTESNVTIALIRLGHKDGCFSKVGEMSLAVTSEFMIRGEGVDV